MSDDARTGYTPLVLLLLAHRPMTQPELAENVRRWTERLPAVPYRPGGLRDAVEELVRAGLVDRSPEHRPDARHGYTVTDAAGAYAAAQSALRALLRTPLWELSDVPVAMSVLPLLDPAEAQTELERRRSAIRERMTELDPRSDDEHPPRNDEPGMELGHVRAYLIAMATAEVDWLTRIVRDLHAGRFSWSPSRLVMQVAELDRPDTTT